MTAERPSPPAALTVSPEASAASAPVWHTLTAATANLLNLALPDRMTYANQEPLGETAYARKIAWLGQVFERLNADVLGVQEVWDEAALKAAAGASGLRYATVVAPGAEQGATGTPRVGLITRLPVHSIGSVVDFLPAEQVVVPELGLLTRFERPVLHAELRTKASWPLHVLVCHLKSKRPKLLQDDAGNPLEDREDPAVLARATLRSLMIRAAEAAALRRVVVQLTQRTAAQPGDALLLLGDMNDGPHAVTTQMIAANQAVAFDRGARDTALYHAWDVATEPALRRDMAYSHVHQGWPELLDQIWVSEEFVAGSRFARGDVRRVEVFNDHLHEGRDRSRSDHGFVRALLRWRV
jgi:endonuclease/exonuclease/phosphatase family metal-dependent hydrolase